MRVPWTLAAGTAVTVASGVVKAVAHGMSHVQVTHGNQLADVVVTVQSLPAR